MLWFCKGLAFGSIFSQFGLQVGAEMLSTRTKITGTETNLNCRALFTRPNSYGGFVALDRVTWGTGEGLSEPCFRVIRTLDLNGQACVTFAWLGVHRT
jgi:hypothetical protein